MVDKVLTPLKDEHKDGWTLIHSEDGSTILTKDGEHYFQVTLDGCSCGKFNCVHQKLVYPTPPPPPRPPARMNPNVDIRQGKPAGDRDKPEVHEWPTNTMMVGLFVVVSGFSIVFRALGWFFTLIGDALDLRIKDDDSTPE